MIEINYKTTSGLGLIQQVLPMGSASPANWVLQKHSNMLLMKAELDGCAASFPSLNALRCSATKLTNRIPKSPIKLSSHTREHLKHCKQNSLVAHQSTDRSLSSMKAWRKEDCSYGKHLISNLYVVASSIVTAYFPILSQKLITYGLGAHSMELLCAQCFLKCLLCVTMVIVLWVSVLAMSSTSGHRLSSPSTLS